MQEQTIGDLLQKLGKPHTKEEDFNKAYQLFKSNSKFKSDIGLTNQSDSEGVQMLKNWCASQSLLQLTEDNIQKVLAKAQKYCLDFEQKALNSLATSKGGVSWRDVKKRLVNKGISANGQFFVSFTDQSNRERGKQKTHSYCWDIEKNNWKSSSDTEDCRKYVNS